MKLSFLWWKPAPGATMPSSARSADAQSCPCLASSRLSSCGLALLSCPQKEGKKLKKFAEKRMKDGKPTHVSSMFLCQVSVEGRRGEGPAQFRA